jgi:hypothetical protein
VQVLSVLTVPTVNFVPLDYGSGSQVPLLEVNPLLRDFLGRSTTRLAGFTLGWSVSRFRAHHKKNLGGVFGRGSVACDETSSARPLGSGAPNLLCKFSHTRRFKMLRILPRSRSPPQIQSSLRDPDARDKFFWLPIARR